MPKFKIKTKRSFIISYKFILGRIVIYNCLNVFYHFFIHVLKKDLKCIFSGHTKFYFDLRKIVETREKLFHRFLRTKVTYHCPVYIF